MRERVRVIPCRFWPILNPAVFTVLVPGTVAVLIPLWLIGGFVRPANGVLTWLGWLVRLPVGFEHVLYWFAARR